MKKFIICTLALCSVMSISAFAGYQINDKYYYSDDTGEIEYIDSEGKEVSKGIFNWADELNGYILAGGDKDMVCLLDENLNEVIPMEYDSIKYNEYTDTYVCHKTDSVDFYDKDFNKISQPIDIRPIPSTEYFELVIVDENSGKNMFYICDKEGNKLINKGYSKLEGGGGSIIAHDNGRSGIYNSRLELAVPFDYFLISYDSGIFRCLGSEPAYYTDKFEKADGENIDQIYGTPYFSKNETNNIYSYICGFTGNVLVDKGYYRIDPSKKNKEIICYSEGTADVYDYNLNLVETRKSDIKFMTPIEGMTDRYVFNIAPEDHMVSTNCCVTDGEGNILSKQYTNIVPKAYPGNTLVAQIPAGHSDTYVCVLDPDFKEIAGPEYGDMLVKEEDGAIYIENVWAGSDTKYYDLYGNQYKTKAEALAAANTKGEASSWAKETIEKAIEIGIVPEELQSKYIKKINRDEFCRLAVNTYKAVTKMEYTTDKSYFRDTDAEYINAAYELQIVSGVGNDMFAPEKNITRQEAAVMLNNLARLLNIKGTENIGKFVDESYFADWAKSSIYSVAAMKSGDTYVMAGTGEGKFSPWMNYTREQAIATMWRLYNCLEGKTDGFLTTYSKSLSNEKDAESKIAQFTADNSELIKGARTIDYVGDDKFLVYWGGDFAFAEVYCCDYCALIDIKGNFIIPKTDNLIINIGYGKFIQYDKADIGYDRDNYTLYDIDGKILDLEFEHLPVNDNIGFLDRYYKMVREQTGEDSDTIIKISSLDIKLIPSDKNVYYNQYNWNATNQQLCDFAKILCDKIDIDYNDIETDVKEILSVNSEFDPFADTSVNSARAVFDYLLKLKDKEDISEEVFVNKNSERYTFEDATLTAYNIYESLTDN